MKQFGDDGELSNEGVRQYGMSPPSLFEFNLALIIRGDMVVT